MIRNDSLNALQRLQARGYKLTVARRQVIAALFRQRRAVTAAELAQLLDGEGTVSLASVYRTLEIMVELGIAETVAHAGDEHRYLACSLEHHHHVICDNCGQVAELDECLLGPFETLVAERTKFAIDGHSLEFHGRCAACQQEAFFLP
jgi:Fur family ferric uptake transcriptional regulator